MHRDKTSSHLVCPSVCEFVPLLIAMFCQLAHQEILQFSPLLKYVSPYAVVSSVCYHIPYVEFS